MFKRVNCEYCGRLYTQSRNNQLYCQPSCRVQANRFKKKMIEADVKVPNPDELKRAKAFVTMEVFKRNMTVLEALEKGHIRIEYQPRLIK